jgi:hypothetical protein
MMIDFVRSVPNVLVPAHLFQILFLCFFFLYFYLQSEKVRTGYTISTKKDMQFYWN